MGDSGKNTRHSRWLLALETSTKVGRVALFSGENFVEERVCPADSNTARSIFPLVQDLVKSHDLSVSEIGAIAVTNGPGSFTGLRVGVTIAKTLAFANGARVRGVNTLQVMARQFFESQSTNDSVIACIDAQRNQLFAAAFERENTALTSEVEIIERSQFLKQIDHQSVVGSGLKKLEFANVSPACVADKSTWTAKAETVGRLALAGWEAGGTAKESFWGLEPEYFRQSAAEEKLSTEN